LPASLAAFPNIPQVVDYNDPNVENCIDTRAQWFIDSSGTQRVSSSTAFLDSTVMTPDGFGVNGHSLRVVFGSVVLKILFDKNGVARRVRFLKDSKIVEVRAKKAIVISSGFNSSKILQLSGIGPYAALANARISPTFVNENVGKHLQNHPTIFISLLANPGDNGIPSGAPYAFTIESIYLPVVGGLASDPRMLQILMEFIPAGVLGSPVPLLIIGFELLNPQSEGSVTIQSDNPFQIAAADDGFYQNPIDLENMKNAIKIYIRDFLNQLALQAPSPFYRPIPGDPINLVMASNYDDAVVENFIRNNTNVMLDVHHHCKHCKMAPLESGGVVDGNTRVYGTQNLYVADNAICPVIPDINTTGSAMMIGLRTSEILKEIL
jgi:choline dehydrogenase